MLCINEDSPLEPKWDYPQSKVAAEEKILRAHGKIPFTILRIAGVYDDMCHLPALYQQIARIYERKLISHVFPGDSTHGQASIHMDDIGRLIHGEEWGTQEIPKLLAKTGAWLEQVALPKKDEPFIKPWMIELADDHYELDIDRARAALNWEPWHRLIATLPNIIQALKEEKKIRRAGIKPINWMRRPIFRHSPCAQRRRGA